MAAVPHSQRLPAPTDGLDLTPDPTVPTPPVDLAGVASQGQRSQVAQAGIQVVVLSFCQPSWVDNGLKHG